MIQDPILDLIQDVILDAILDLILDPILDLIQDPFVRRRDPPEFETASCYDSDANRVMLLSRSWSMRGW